MEMMRVIGGNEKGLISNVMESVTENWGNISQWACCQCVFVSVGSSVHLPACLPACLPVCLSVSQSVSLLRVCICKYACMHVYVHILQLCV
jgi:hypothetical protein